MGFGDTMEGSLTWRIGFISCTATLAAILVVLTRFKFISKNNRAEEQPPVENDDKNVVNNTVSEVEEEVLDNSNKELKVMRKTINDIEELPEPRWIKVGRIKELYVYPLKSGRGRQIQECEFTEYGIGLRNKGALMLRDRMLLVYSEETGKFITGRNYPTLILVNLSAVDETRVRLEATGVPNLTFELPQYSNDSSSNTIDCKMWWGEPVKCIDCGTAPAQWISNFLTGTDSGLRVGLALPGRRNILKGPWERFTKVYETLRNEDTGFFADLASYMLMSESSLEELNRRLKNPTSSLQYRPNILVSGSEPFAEDNWEWIKIGDSVVIRNVKPCPRCSMIGVDPETGVLNKSEPFKVLKSFREPTDERRIKVDGRSPVMGIYCGLYSPGSVKIGDDVYVHIQKNFSMTSL